MSIFAESNSETGLDPESEPEAEPDAHLLFFDELSDGTPAPAPAPAPALPQRIRIRDQEIATTTASSSSFRNTTSSSTSSDPFSHTHPHTHSGSLSKIPRSRSEPSAPEPESEPESEREPAKKLLRKSIPLRRRQRQRHGQKKKKKKQETTQTQRKENMNMIGSLQLLNVASQVATAPNSPDFDLTSILFPLLRKLLVQKKKSKTETETEGEDETEEGGYSSFPENSVLMKMSLVQSELRNRWASDRRRQRRLERLRRRRRRSCGHDDGDVSGTLGVGDGVGVGVGVGVRDREASLQRNGKRNGRQKGVSHFVPRCVMLWDIRRAARERIQRVATVGVRNDQEEGEEEEEEGEIGPSCGSARNRDVQVTAVVAPLPSDNSRNRSQLLQDIRTHHLHQNALPRGRGRGRSRGQGQTRSFVRSLHVHQPHILRSLVGNPLRHVGEGPARRDLIRFYRRIGHSRLPCVAHDQRDHQEDRCDIESLAERRAVFEDIRSKNYHLNHVTHTYNHRDNMWLMRCGNWFMETDHPGLECRGTPRSIRDLLAEIRTDPFELRHRLVELESRTCCRKGLMSAIRSFSSELVLAKPAMLDMEEVYRKDPILHHQFFLRELRMFRKETLLRRRGHRRELSETPSRREQRLSRSLMEAIHSFDPTELRKSGRPRDRSALLQEIRVFACVWQIGREEDDPEVRCVQDLLQSIRMYSSRQSSPLLEKTKSERATRWCDASFLDGEFLALPTETSKYDRLSFGLFGIQEIQKHAAGLHFDHGAFTREVQNSLKSVNFSHCGHPVCRRDLMRAIRSFKKENLWHWSFPEKRNSLESVEVGDDLERSKEMRDLGCRLREAEKSLKQHCSILQDKMRYLQESDRSCDFEDGDDTSRLCNGACDSDEERARNFTYVEADEIFFRQLEIRDGNWRAEEESGEFELLGEDEDDVGVSLDASSAHLDAIHEEEEFGSVLTEEENDYWLTRADEAFGPENLHQLCDDLSEEINDAFAPLMRRK